MEAAFAWIGDIIQWFGQWFPRWAIVDTTQGWIKWVGGSKVRTGKHGIVWWWPARTKLLILPIVRDSINCKSQTITLQSGETIFIELVVIYEIGDIEKLAANTAEPIATIADLTMGAGLYVVEGYESWGEMQKQSIRQPRARDSEFYRALKIEVQKALEPYGVTVLNVFLQNKAKCRVLKLVNSQEES